jgi:hypothetical protein
MYGVINFAVYYALYYILLVLSNYVFHTLWFKITLIVLAFGISIFIYKQSGGFEPRVFISIAVFVGLVTTEIFVDIPARVYCAAILVFIILMAADFDGF